MASRKKGKAVTKVTKRRVTVQESNVIVQTARGKTVRQNAYVVNVRVQQQPRNTVGMTRPMNPNVHTIAIPSQAPFAYPSAVVNRASTMEMMASPVMTMTNNPTYQTTPMPTPMGSPMSAFGTGMSTGMSAGMSTGMVTPTSRRLMTPAPGGEDMNHREQHRQAFERFNAQNKPPYTTLKSRQELLALGHAVRYDTDNAGLALSLEAPNTRNFYRNVHDALRRTLY